MSFICSKLSNAHAFHCVLLKNAKVQTKKSQEEEMAVKEINIAFATPIPMLIETTFTTLSILRLEEVSCL